MRSGAFLIVPQEIEAEKKVAAIAATAAKKSVHGLIIRSGPDRRWHGWREP